MMALLSNLSGYCNTAVGRQALTFCQTGNYNVSVGLYSSYAITNTSYNTSVGSQAGDYYRFSSGTFLGALAYPNAHDFTNCMALGYNAHVDASNKAVIGNTSVTSIGGYVNWSNFSDGRFKRNIREDVPGLSFINQLRPITYNLDISAINAGLDKNKQPGLREGEQAQSLSDEDLAGISEKEKIVYTGFIAQEVEDAARKIDYDFSGIDKPKDVDAQYGLRYAEFVVPLVKAVQELSTKVDELERELAELKGKGK
jgi:hypothetical protein